MAKPMNLLYISHYFPPEVNAPAARVSEMGSRWTRKGARVTVLTGFPNHPNGVIPKEYRGKIRQVEAYNGIKVIRTWMYAAPNKGFLKRITNYLSFMVSSVLLGAGKVGKPDVLIATSPQFFVGLSGYLLSRIKGCKFVFEIRDLWPEEIVAVGAIKSKWIISFLESIEMFLYRKADLIVAVAQGTIDTLVNRGVPLEKMLLIPNGVSMELFVSENRGADIRSKLGFQDKIVVSYIGTHGMAHRLDTVLKAAELLKSTNPNIQFMFVGDGAEKSHLIDMANSLGLSNVTFHDQVSRDWIAAYYQASDICLVPLRAADLFTRNIPSKIYEIMASRRPIIISTNGESREMVESSGAGVGVTPEDHTELANAIQEMSKDPGQREKMGFNGYSFAWANCSRTRWADNYLEALNCLVGGRTLSLTQPEPLPGKAIRGKKDRENSQASVS
jgi:colanic acid biosynthesis glycosyl transferase WcaI